MRKAKPVVLDANILIRGILGVNVPHLINKYCDKIDFFTAECCYEDVKKHLPAILKKRGVAPELAMEPLKHLTRVVWPIGEDIYTACEDEAKRRIGKRDEDDWHVIALALTLDSPIWTEDKDFFGTGVATWNSGNIEVYLSG